MGDIVMKTIVFPNNMMADITPSLMGWVMLMWNCMN